MNRSKDSLIVVVGASAGGMAALKELVAQFPKDFPAPIFIVNHMGANTTGEVLVKVLNDSSNLTCVHAQDNQKFRSGYIYLAPSDQHMLLETLSQTPETLSQTPIARLDKNPFRLYG